MKTLIYLLVTLTLMPPSLDAAIVQVTTTIQAAVDAAQPGDTILIPPGTYRENIRIAKDNLSLRGSSGAVLDGTGLPDNVGIRVVPSASTSRINGFSLTGLQIQNYSHTGVFLSRVDNFKISQGRYFDNEEYAIFPVRSSNGCIELNQVSGSEDSGIYVGQSQDVVISRNHTTDCRVGFEIENSSGIDIEENKVNNNSIGIFIFVRPGLPITSTSDLIVSRNVLNRNNRTLPPANPENPLENILNGIGLLNVGGDRVVVRRNIAVNNDSAGIALVRVPAEVAALDPRIDPLPDDNEIRHNETRQNGDHPHPLLGSLPGSDLIWDGTGTDNCWSDNVFKTAFPVLPSCQS
jgi:parallel beta-helix repeat protein